MHDAPNRLQALGAATLEEAPTSGPQAGTVTSVAPLWRFSAEDGSRVEVTLLAADLLRVRLLPPGVALAPSWAVDRADTEWPEVRASVEEHRGRLALTTDAMTVHLSLDPFRVRCVWPNTVSFAEDDLATGMGYEPPLGPNDPLDPSLPPGSVWCSKRLAPGERILGAGERTGSLDRRGQHLVFYNVDPPLSHSEQTGSMYVSIPFWLGLRQGRAYGLFLDSAWQTELDAGARQPDIQRFGAAGGPLTYYVFAGPEPRDVLARYADLTGHMPLPPRWALGYGQSRWSYYPEEYLRDVAREFRERGIPCDSLWLDIDYMDGYRVFTWNPTRFPDPARMLADLRDDGFKVVTILDPGVKVDSTDPTYREGVKRDYFVRNADRTLFSGAVWPGMSAFPDFPRAEVRDWWGERQRTLLEAGVAGIWDDMNEPSLTTFFVRGAPPLHGATLPSDVLHWPEGKDEPPVPHEALHNVYGMQMARATYDGQRAFQPDGRPFVLSRSGYAGVQRYAALWTGDNSSRWEHLRLAVRVSLGLGLSGVPFVGFDAGGFWENATGEMLVRFLQLGALFPLYRNHSARGTVAQEPWAFGQPYTALCREAIELRYRLLPYLYTLLAEASRTGTPVTRPMAYAYPDESELAACEEQFLVGEDILAAPVMRENEFSIEVVFPRGAWCDWRTGERQTGVRRATVDAALDVLPLFVREGAIVPLGPVMQYVGELDEEPLTLACWLGPESDAHAEGELYEDDGESQDYTRGEWRRTRIRAERTPKGVSVRAVPVDGSFAPVRRPVIAELHLPHSGEAGGEIGGVTVDGRPQPDATVEQRRYEVVVRVPLGMWDGAIAAGIELL